MPVIKVYGIPRDTPEKKLLKLMADYGCIISGINELHLEASQVSTFFPSDLVSERPKEEIIVFVQSLYERPERTEEVIHRVAEGLGRRTKHYFPDALVECFIELIRLNQGFRCWSSFDEDALSLEG